MKTFLHRLRHWEYWPAYLVYAPTALLWIYWMIRFRNFRFYRYVNPGITNGGFYGDRKSDIYALLPQGSFPKTVLVRRNEVEKSGQLIRHAGLCFPLIVKPDIGLRGRNVALVNSLEELMIQAKDTNQDFLIQECISYPYEIGLFYARIPGEATGKITGITIKAMLTVTGNGKETIAQLLQQNPRFAMQIPILKNKFNLQEILDKGATRCLVPFGNHNRGTAFYDGHHQLTVALQRTWVDLLDQVDGFYYGRLDIRFASWEALEKGHEFSIIELNGAKSEPTHIYDPAYSWLKGQRIIFQHQRLLSTIAGKNLKRKKTAQ